MFENLVKKENIIREKLSRLELAITFAKKIISAQVPRDFIERKENLKTKKLNELNEDFWGPLLPLLELSSKLEPIMDSESFKNVATNCLSENNGSWLLTADDNDTDRLHALFKFLSTHVIPRFEVEWNRLHDDPDSQTFETMAMLQGLRSEEDLVKELSILESFLKMPPTPVKLNHYMSDYVRYESVVKQVDIILHVLDTFELRNSDNVLVDVLTKFEKEFRDNDSIRLKDLHSPMTEVSKIICKYLNGNNNDVIEVLGESKELIGFLKEIVNEDIRILIDAVEEHSDQFVSESLVSDLIHVQSFIVPVIEILQNDTSDQLPEVVLQELKDQCEVERNMASKIDQCNQHVHSLKQLYQSVANRGEVTRDVIANCLLRGKVNVSLDSYGTCKIQMSYMQKDEEDATYSLSDLHDLRSRAHLIVTSGHAREKTSVNEEHMETNIDFVDFIKQINILCDVEELILKLRSSGYIKYRTIDEITMTGTEELLQLKDELLNEMQMWEKSINKGRQQHFFLNYYWSDHLYVLFDFLTNPNRDQVNFEDVITLIHFVDRTINEHVLQEYGEHHSRENFNRFQDCPHKIISMIGDALDEIFKNTQCARRTILEREISSSSHVIPAVQPGELYVAVLKKECPDTTINVMLSLYENTSNTYPEPNQIVFCDSSKQWTEIQLFMKRCFLSNKDVEQKSLFCLANVELLENEVQFKLIEFIKEAQRNDEGKYLLAIICRGGDHHHIVEEFLKFSHHVAGMPYPEISQRFQSSWPNVKFITSTLPGLGKTEFIRQEALEEGMNVVTFPISGQIDQSKIIKRLKQLNLRDFQCLHFDIGEVDDPVLLDTFLFQLIVTGMVSFGTQLYSLHNNRVYIEIANSLNDGLHESLVIVRCFTCHECKWNNYNDLKVSSKITSDIQVVCHYLDVLERNKLELTDIVFSGELKVKPLPANRCRELLRKNYLTETGTTFTALNTFLGLLADQLRKFSKSSFFKTKQIKYMTGKKAKGVRKNLFEALLEVSKKFAARAIETSRSRIEQLASSSSDVDSMNTAAEHMVKRVEKMIHWEQTKHLFIVFHGNNSQAITAFYRKKEDVPPRISDLLTNQIVKGDSKDLDDFEEMNPDKLQEKLEKIARTKPRTNQVRSQEDECSGYVLTPDNMLKMILIILRMRANVPIIIMGETGCGKTSLIKYLASICEIRFCPFNIHAGRTEEEIKNFVNDQNEEAYKTTEDIWVFFDEINTCDHLGLINEVLCHHSMNGQPLATNLVFLAACNPYKKRPQDRIVTAGLEVKDMIDEYSGLVYRVHPLPEAMVDYIWDYGSLTPQDEKSYIRRMVQNSPFEPLEIFVELLAESQKFIRESERNHFCVSLRDVHRCIVLAKWFMTIVQKSMKMTNSQSRDKWQKHLTKYRELAQGLDDKPDVKSVILALAHCYLSRLETDELRKNYHSRMANLFPPTTVSSGEVFSAIIRMEQEYYLDRMELPPGTAKNSALRENVFVMLVSILNRIPVFVVGKPGCSKSLAIQLIRSNLRGKDSKDCFFKTLPQLYVVSYQGSESSTSEGIIKIFEKASNYNKDANVLPVVLLDEVGLAENSPNNPLKVLHNILEPGKGELPEVAVVGISNWALDAAKMNRAIHLSRPEPTVEDLEDTAISLCQANIKLEDEMDASTRNVLNCLAKAYHEYQSKQVRANFHGLRDYYSLVKSLRADSCNDMKKINVALQRNFGGIPIESSNLQEAFIDKLKYHVPTTGDNVPIPVTTLIKENLIDLKARHLMLITHGDSAIGILNKNLSILGKEIITIFGSRFEEDMSDDYSYRMLSRIILCMERDCVLILRDLECIYGSLYDMLNQNYAVVGKRKNCRVALGANSNPMCYVNDGFRCIVLVDYDKVDYSDPPFLNRFEKQLLRFSDVLNEKQKEIIEELQSWVCQMSRVEDREGQFQISDMFMGFHEDTLPSLVLLHSNDTDEPNEEIVKKCKDDLMWIATPDGVVRTQKCQRSKENSREVKMLADEYFEKPIHNGLASFFEFVTNDQEFTYSTGGEVGTKTIVMTYATVHTDIRECLDGSTITYQLERLGAFRVEKQLEDRIHTFFSSDRKLLILQCKPEIDFEHMLLARSILEDERNSYEKNYRELNSTKQRKHVCILIHMRRGKDLGKKRWQFNHLCGWKQVFLDVISEPPVSVNEVRTEPIDRLLTSSGWSFEKFFKDSKCLLWCFKCIKYTKKQRSLEQMLHNIKRISESEKLFKTIESIVNNHVRAITAEKNGETWPVRVALDIETLINSSTFSFAIEHYLYGLVRDTLAKIIYFLERENAWPARVFPDDENALSKYENVWCKLISKETILDLRKIPAPLGTEFYIVDGICLDLLVPFSQVIIQKVNVAKEPVLKECQLYRQENEENNRSSQEEQMDHYTRIVKRTVPDICDLPVWCLNFYLQDFLNFTLASFSCNMNRQRRISIGECALLSFAFGDELFKENPLYLCVQFHVLMWNFGQQITDQMRLINVCERFIDQSVVDKLLLPKKQLEKSFALSNRPSFIDNDVIDDPRMTIDVDVGQSENAQPSLKRKSDQLPQHQDDSPRKKGKYELIQQSDASEATSCNSRCEGDEPDFQDDLGRDTNVSDKNESESESSNSESSDEESGGETSDSESSVSNDESGTNEKSNVYEEDFEDILVTKLCEEMFPSKNNVERNGGLESWIRNSSLLLSLAFKVSNQTPAFHFLRLCVDYAKLGEQTNNIGEDYLYVLDEIAMELKPEYLDKHESLQKLTDKLLNPLTEKLEHGTEEYVVIQKFLAKFYSRFIDTYDDIESAVPIVKNVLSIDRDDLVLLMKPVIYKLMYACQTESKGIFFKMIVDQTAITNCPFLKGIDKVFLERFSKERIHHDSYPAVLICDAITSILMLEELCIIEKLTDPECELLKCLRSATKIVNGSKDKTGLVLLSSVALLRVFYTKLSKYIYGKKETIPVMSEVNFLLAVNGARKSSIQVFFLKQLYRAGLTMFDIRELCCDNNQLPVFTNQIEQCKIVNKVELVSVYRLPEYKEVEDAYWQLTQKNSVGMLTILKKCQNSANHRLALLGILTNTFYVKKALGNLSNDKEHLAKWFFENSKDLPSPSKELLLRIVGRETFEHRGLQISLESSTVEIETALLILHVSCVVASRVEGEISPLFQYLSSPENCRGACILAHREGRKRRVFDQFTLYDHLPVTCSCKLRMKFKNNQGPNICPYCGTESNECEATSFQQIKTYFLETKSKEWEECTENMDASVYRALHLIVYSCLYAGVATGISSSEAVSLLLSPDTQGSNSAPECEDSANFCLNRIKDDLQHLMTILSCNRRSAVDVMHLVVEECFTNGTFSTEEEECAQLENKFAVVAKDVLSKALGSDRPLKEIRMKYDKKIRERSLQMQIQELDEYPSGLEQQDAELKRLFRVTKQPSFTELRSLFLNSSKDFQEQHSVMAVLLSKFDELPYLACLYPLLEWSRLVSSSLTHRISRKEARKTTINDFIESHLLQQGRMNEERARKLFNNFENAWNKMRDFVNQYRDQEEMPYLTEYSTVGYCLTGGDLSVHLRKAIEILQSIQNKILDDMILISLRTQHSALEFLEKNETCCAVMTVSLQEAKEKDIINFDWSDDFLTYAQKLEYRHGEEIDYDFERMEKELVNEIVFEKCYLTESLNEFIFFGELFHSSAKTLTTIRELCPQSSGLPDEIRNGIKRLEERRHQDAQNLLQNIEVVMFLLSKQSDPVRQEMMLTEFADKWKPKLPSPFPVNLLPEPKQSIQLTHIAALYEALEDLLADGTIKGLPRQFRTEMTENTLVDSRIGSLNLKQFLTALRRFVFRYLSADEFFPDPRTQLRSCLREPSLWSPDQPPNPDAIPEEMMLENIHSIITQLQQVCMSRLMIIF